MSVEENLANMIDYSFKPNGDLGVGEMSFEYDGNRVYISVTYSS
jgi:hypothetical protein